MQPQFLGYDEEESAPSGKGGLFLWSIFILLLIGLVIACWMSSFYIFGHPEQPQAYQLLKKLKKIEPPRRFEVYGAPLGTFLTPQKLFEEFGTKAGVELQVANAEMMRDYIRNYKDTSRKVLYMTGRFTILSAWELGDKDVINSGVVALAQATDFPQVLIEHIYPADKKNVASLKELLPTGLDMKIERTLDLSAVINVQRLADGRLLFTAMPLLYGSYALRGGAGTFKLVPPSDLYLEAGIPILKADRIADASKRYASWRRGRAIEDPAEQTRSAMELVRLDAIPTGVAVPERGELPEMRVAVARPVNLPNGSGPIPGVSVITPTTTPRVVIPPVQTPMAVALLTTPPPAATPEIPIRIATAVVRATPAPPPDAPPLKPFLVSNPAPVFAVKATKQWALFDVGQLPPGRQVTASDVSQLADRGDLGERVYLTGEFQVTASGGNNAVMRPKGVSNTVSNGVRIIVEYPNGYLSPDEGSSVTRDPTRAFQVREVRRGENGEINVTVREIVRS